MAARQIINFLETGTIVNSVNFPNAALATQSTGTTRLCIINENKPGVLGQITTLLGGMNVNIAQQLNVSREERIDEYNAHYFGGSGSSSDPGAQCGFDIR